MNISRFILLCLLSIFICACSRKPDLPQGVSVDVADSGDVVVTLKPEASLMVRQFPKGKRFILVGNIDDKLQIQQSENTASTRSLDILSPTEARYSSMIQKGNDPKGLVLVIDDNGDGIPDKKVENLKKYRLKNITWEAVSSFDKTEQGAAANP